MSTSEATLDVIELSVMRNEIVHIDWNARVYADLDRMSDGSCATDTETEFWSNKTDVDDNWRIHVVHPTPEIIETLSAEAVDAGDALMVMACNRALNGLGSGMARVIRVLVDAAAQEA